MTETSSISDSTSERATVTLKRGREKSLRHRHPWVFSGAVEAVTGTPEAGDVVAVVDAGGRVVARGYYNAASRIPVRVLSWGEEPIDDAWWRRRVQTAVEARAVLDADPDTDAYRLVHAEADLIPGLVADRYRDVVVVQFLTAGVERVREVILDAFSELLAPSGIIERSDTASRRREGLAASSGVVRGEAPARIDIVENGHTFTVDLTGGQKTGFYLDQRGNRRHVAAFARDRRVLDAFSYTGAFSVNALAAGAQSATIVDSSEAALLVAEQHLEQNGIVADRAELIQADVFELLRAYRDEGRRFDMVILDPPKFATNRHQLENAMRGYKDINMLAMSLLEPGGILATFSCSAAVGVEEFTLAVSWAGVDAARDIQILRRLSQGIDHPVLASFPESEYLKGLICRIL